MRGIVDEMVVRGGEKGNGDREKMIHLICRFMTDMKFDHWSLERRADDREEKTLETKEESVVEEMDVKISCFIITMASKGYEDIFRTLEKEELDLDYETTFFGTPLNAATRLKRLDLVEMLLAKGADPDVQSAEYHSTSASAQEVAAELGCLDIIKLFYSPRFPAGQEERACSWDQAVTQAAAAEGNLDIVEFVLDRHQHVCEVSADEALLNAACQYGNLALVERLVDADVSLWECAGDDYVRPIVAAAKNGHREVVEYLLDAEAENENEGGNAFEEAATNGHFDIVFMMLERGFREAPPDGEEDEEEDEDGDEDELQFIDLETAYEGAGRHGNLAAAQKIWDKYDTHPPRKKDWCSVAFHWAVYFGHPALIEWFIDKMGCDVDLYPFEWKTELVPLVEAVKNGRPESVACLLGRGARLIDVEEEGMRGRIEFEKMTPGKAEAVRVLADWKGRM